MMEIKTPEQNTRQIVEHLRINGLWEPRDMGLSYVRMGAKSLKLIAQENSNISEKARCRMRTLIENIGWDIDESGVEIVDITGLNPQEIKMRSLKRQQVVAKYWHCTNCATQLSTFPLNEGVWRFDGEQEMACLDQSENKDGQSTELVEQWTVVITCPDCDTFVPMEPYDFFLMAGENVMTKHHSSKATYVSIQKPEIINLVDNNLSDTMIILGTNCPFSGQLLPPHFRGLVVTYYLHD